MAEPLSLPAVVVVTGTGTGVGKTVATAALAAILRARGTDVVVVKVAQTGVAPGDAGDIEDVCRLAGPVPTHEFVRLPDPLAPDTAARRAGVALPTIGEHARSLRDLAATVDVVLVEGAGGLLVRLDERGATLADLGVALRYLGTSCGVVLVASAGLGTLNTAALTAEALRHRQLPLLGVVIGSWPDQPDLASRCNLADLPEVTRAPLWGRIPHGAGSLTTSEFTDAAAGWIDLG